MPAMASLVQGVVDFATSHPILVTVAAVAVLLGLTTDRSSSGSESTSSSDVPFFGEKTGAKGFSWRTRWLYYTDCVKLFRDAHDRYSRDGRTVRIPGIGYREEVILPPSAVRWMITQPEHILSVVDAFAEMDQIDYSLGNSSFVKDPWPAFLVKKELNSVLETIALCLQDELFLTMDEEFGVDTKEWKEIDLNKTLPMLIARAASRFTVGLPLCRDNDYLRDAVAFNDSCIVNAGITGGAPKTLRPLVGRIAALPVRACIGRIKKKVRAIYDERLALVRRVQAGSDEKEPQDLFQMMMRYAVNERPEDLPFDHMAKRLAITNFGSMHQTTIAAINLFLDVASSQATHRTADVLREEATRVIGDDLRVHGVWTRHNIARMTCTDSAIRESMRWHTFGNRAIIRKVMADGVTTDDGTPLPKGVLVSVMTYPIHRNEEIFENPDSYDPLRYARQREASDAKAGNLSFVTTGPQFLPFGHGKHACPGRFLVDLEFKILISYLVVNYELTLPSEFGGRRPENRWVAEATLPPLNARIMVKRRTGTV